VLLGVAASDLALEECSLALIEDLEPYFNRGIRLHATGGGFRWPE
jgi:hypothetical protein